MEAKQKGLPESTKIKTVVGPGRLMPSMQEVIRRLQPGHAGLMSLGVRAGHCL